MAIKTIRVFAEYTSDGYVPMPSQGNIDYGVTVGSTFPETQPNSFQTDDPNIDVAVTTMTDFYVWIRTHGSAWNPNYTRVVRVYPDSPSINSVVMNMIVAVGGGGTTISSGGGVNYYLNGGTSQGILDGSTYYEMNKVPVQGAGVDFFKINTTGFENIAQFVTDAGDPGLLNIPAGNWPLGFFMSASDNSGAPKFYAEIYKYSAAGVFTLLGSNVTTPEVITNGQAIDYYTTNVTIPETTLLVTDRIAIRIFVNTDGNRTINLHTQDSHLSTVGTTFTRGLTAINGLIKQVQFLAIGNAGSDAAIVSSDDTHTINLPTASATKRGLLNSTDWSTFNAKQPALSGDGFVKISGSTISYDNSSYQPLDGDLTAIGALAGTSGILKKTGTNTWELDTSVYLSTATAASTYQRLDKMVSNLLPSDTEYPNSNAVLAKLALKADAANPSFTGSMNISGAESRVNFYDENAARKYYIGYDGGFLRIYQDAGSTSRFYINSSGKTFIPGTLEVGTIIKTGGLATEFLKADGSVDSNTYALNSALANYLLSATAGTTYQTLANLSTDLTASTTKYPSVTAVNTGLATKQPLDADLTAIAALTGTSGLLKKTAADTWTLDTAAYITSSALTNYLLSADAATTYQRKDKMVSNLLASDTEYPNSNAVIAALALKANAANPTFTGDFTISGTTPRLYFVDTDNNPDYTLFTDSGYFYIYDQTAGSTKFQITPSGNAINTGTLTSASFIKSGGTSSQYLMADGSVSTLSGLVTGSGTTNYLPKWTSASGIGNSLIFDNGTNVGINTNDPKANFHVNGSTATLRVGPWFSSSDRDFIELQAHGTDTKIISPNERFHIDNSAAGLLVLNGLNNGNVSIGTTTDSGRKLTVNGEIRTISGVVDFGNGVSSQIWGGDSGMNIKVNSTERIIISSNGLSNILGTDVSGGRTSPLNVLTITAENGNAPYNGFGGTILFNNRAYTSGIVSSTRIRSQINNNSVDNSGGSLHFDVTPTVGGTLTQALVLNYNGAATFSSSVSGSIFYSTGATSVNSGLSIEPSGWNGAKHRFSVPVSGDTSMLSFNYNGSVVDSALYGTSAINVSSGVLTFLTGTTNTAPSERMRITSSGNVGIGTNVISQNFAGYTHLDIGNATTGGILLFSNASGTNYGYVNGEAGGVNMRATVGNLTFNTGATERMRITSGGNVLIGTTTDNGTARLQVNGGILSLTDLSYSAGYALYPRNASVNDWWLGKYVNSGTEQIQNCIGQSGTNNWRLGYFNPSNSSYNTTTIITALGAATFSSSVTATSFFESSDFRLKTLIESNPIIDGIEKLEAKLYEKNGKIELGYFAQDAELIMPYAVTKNADGFLNLSYREVHTAKIARLEREVEQLKKQLNVA